MGLLDGKVVLVTGAGGGIGRAHALACAREGAKVVVNDLGGTRDGSGAGNAMADKVVAEIVELGGEAAANYDSVTDYEGCERMVQTALDSWGRLDVVVNNAGILRDKTFAKMQPGEWDLVMAVHMTGTRNVTKAALDALKASGAGRIVNTTSLSGMIGNFGQSNYAAAKAGIYGFTRVLALELRKYGVTANCVAPVAKTRMTEDIDMVEDEWTPDQISPIVVYLASDLAKSVTGRVFGVQGQRIHLYEVKTNDGVEKEGSELWTAEEIHAAFADITGWAVAAADEGDADDGDLVSQVFALFPEGFNASAGVKAVYHWKVAGGTDQTVAVDGETCTITHSLVGEPTCTIELKKDVLLAIFSGELDATKAFMTGKAKADNMGDLMKMGMAFDFKKVGAAFEASRASAETDVVSDVFDYIPKGFKPGAVKAVFHWKVAGGTDQTIAVDGETCEIHHSLVGEPTCTIEVAKDVLVAMFSGELDATKAFMSGKAKADNMMDLMKLGTAFDFKKVAEAYKADHAAPAAAPEEAPTAGGPAPIGKRYNGGYWQIDRAQFQAYASATDDDNPAYFGDDPVAPPMFHVRPFIDLMQQLAADPELDIDIGRLVHGEHAMSFHKPLRHGDVLELRGSLQDVQEKSSGTLYAYGLTGFVDGEVAVEGRTSYFVRGKKSGGDKKKAAPAAEPPAPSATIEQAVADDITFRYAEASGDKNPIHVDREFAKNVGLPDIIVHGLCTMAFAQRDIINQFADGDPTRLKSLGVRWAKPVLPGSSLTLKVWDQGDGALAFMTENADGKPVVVNGTATIS